MKIVHLMTSVRGGAAKAAIRLHHALLDKGIESHVLSADDAVSTDVKNHSIVKPLAEPDQFHFLKTPFDSQKWQLKKIYAEDKKTYFAFNRKEFELFTWHRTPYIQLHTHPLIHSADIVQLHWVGFFVDYPSFFSQVKKPIVWTMHDMAPFTGGCHYALQCRNFETNCSPCPQLVTEAETRAAKNFSGKKKSLLNQPLVFVADSHWLAAEGQKSSLGKGKTIKTIHYGIETDIFVPTASKNEAKKQFGIPVGTFTIGFGAENINNRRKGWMELMDALAHLSKKHAHLSILTFGTKPEQGIELPFQQFHQGPISTNKTLAEIYQACDVFVVPSLVEAFGQTAIEAMGCGVPVVGFDTSGLRDSIIPFQTGLLANVGDASDLAEKINYFIENPEEGTKIGKQAREWCVSQFGYYLQVDAYKKVYKDLLSF